ncbi:MAG: hypothetical protein NVS9B8_18020 [Candidatus Limnocylindrales bacterium]
MTVAAFEARIAAGESIETIDHVVRALDAATLLIADRRAPLGIAGIMGGASSEVSATTTRVIVESAIFDPILIRRTGQRYALRSEASLRFEKGQEVRLARLGADRAARLIAEWAGGEVARGRVDSAPLEPEPTRVAFRPARVNRLLGTTLDAGAQAISLARVGIATEAPPADPATIVTIAGGSGPLTIEPRSDEIVVAVIPTWRRDMAIEADVAEEVARIIGYDTIPAILPHTPMPDWRPAPLMIRDRIRDTLAGAGLTEAVSHALVSPRPAERFVWSADVPPVPTGTLAGGRPIHVTNPLSTDHSVLRQAIVGSLVDIVSTNLRHGRDDIAIFEVGKGYGRDGGLTREWWRLGLALAGAFEIPSWNRPRRAVDIDDAKGLIELVCQRLGLDAPAFETLPDEPLLHPGRAARVVARRSGEVALSGVLGELHPAVAADSALRGARLIVAEVDIDGLAAGRPAAIRADPPPRHLAAERDLAIVVDEGIAAAAVAALIRAAAGPDLVSLDLFDMYRGAPLAAGDKSLAWRLSFQTDGRTPTEADVEAAVVAVGAALAGVGGRIRT